MDTYLDYNATSPLRPQAREAIVAAWQEAFANPASVHRFGQRAARVLDTARRHVAAFLDANPAEIVFVSSGTEAANLAILGMARESGRTKVALSAIEHPAVSGPCERLGQEGWEVVRLPVTRLGVVDLEEAERLIDDETALVCVMLANNEVGTIQPVREIAAMAHAKGALVYCDAVQAVGRIPVDVRTLGADACGLSAHKMGGPKGIGVLWVAPGTPMAPLMLGGGQERGLRPGTVNVPAAAGLGAVCRWLGSELTQEAERLKRLRDRLEQLVLERVAEARITAQEAERLPNTTNLSAGGIEADVLQVHLDMAGFAVSTTSACSSGAARPSRVLEAMGYSTADALRTIRVSLGWKTTQDEVERFVEALAGIVEDLRESRFV